MTADGTRPAFVAALSGIGAGAGHSGAYETVVEGRGGSVGAVVETIDTAEELEKWRPAWHDLEARAGNPFPFRTHEWAQTWWKHFCEERRLVKDSLFIRAIRDPAGELLAIAPLMLTTRGIGPVRVRALQFLGPDEYVTEMGGMLCKLEDEEVAYRALVGHLRENCSAWDWIAWSGLRPHGASGRIVEEAGNFEWSYQTPNYALAIPTSWAEFRERLPRNVKESLRKCYNSLKRDGLRFTFEVAREPADVGSALSDFFRLHAARSQLESTVRHKDFFRRDRARRFLADVCDQLARRGATRVFALKIGGQTVASRVGFVLGQTLYLYYSGYDPAFRRYSVMTTLVAEAIRMAIGDGLRCVNLSMGTDVSKTRWRPQETAYAEGLQVCPRFGARVCLLGYRQSRKFLALAPVRRFASRHLWRRWD